MSGSESVRGTGPMSGWEPVRERLIEWSTERFTGPQATVFRVMLDAHKDGLDRAVGFTTGGLVRLCLEAGVGDQLGIADVSPRAARDRVRIILDSLRTHGAVSFERELDDTRIYALTPAWRGVTQTIPVERSRPSRSSRKPRRERSRTISGTKTWRDGLSQLRADQIECECADIAEEHFHSESPALVEQLCRTWVKLGKGANAKKVIREVMGESGLPNKHGECNVCGRPLTDGTKRCLCAILGARD